MSLLKGFFWALDVNEVWLKIPRYKLNYIPEYISYRFSITNKVKLLKSQTKLSYPFLFSSKEIFKISKHLILQPNKLHKIFRKCKSSYHRFSIPPLFLSRFPKHLMLLHPETCNTYVYTRKISLWLDYPGNNPFSRTRLTKRGWVGRGEASTTPLSLSSWYDAVPRDTDI